MKEGAIQLQIMHLLKKVGYLTMTEIMRCDELGCELPPHKGMFGRVNTMAVPVVKNKRIIGYRKNPYIFLGMPDIMGFRHKDIDAGFYTPFAIECKRPTKDLETAQRIYKDWFVKAGGLYIRADDIEDIRPLL